MLKSNQNVDDAGDKNETCRWHNNFKQFDVALQVKCNNK